MKKIYIRAGIMVIMLAAMPAAVWSYSGGSGTPGDPYQIANKADLEYLSENSGEWSKHFIQTADITFADSDFESGGDFYNNGAGFIPIGNLSTEFTGSYDGGGHTISNLFINRGGTDRFGFFGRIDSGATVENICLAEVDITVSATGDNTTGGLVGQSYGTVSNTCVTGSVTGASTVGGLVGQTESSSSTSDSYSTAAVSGTSSVGGLVGSSYSSISGCYSTGDVSGTSSVGGLVGSIWGNSVSNCYSKGDVTRTSGTQTTFGGFCGGVINMSSVTIQKCYSIGSVSCGSATDKGFVGGESGESGTYTNNFFDSEASNQNSDAVGAATAKTTAQMKTGSTFTDAGWDFTNTWTISAGSNDGYPYLQDTPLVVDLVSFTATGFEDHVLLEWETASEIDTAGFHLWRSETEDGEYVRITDSLIPAQGSPTLGVEYEYEDLDVEPGRTYYYKLEDIDTDGLNTFHAESVTLRRTASNLESSPDSEVGSGVCFIDSVTHNH